MSAASPASGLAWVRSAFPVSVAMRRPSSSARSSMAAAMSSSMRPAFPGREAAPVRAKAAAAAATARSTSSAAPRGTRRDCGPCAARDSRLRCSRRSRSRPNSPPIEHGSQFQLPHASDIVCHPPCLVCVTRHRSPRVHFDTPMLLRPGPATQVGRRRAERQREAPGFPDAEQLGSRCKPRRRPRQNRGGVQLNRQAGAGRADSNPARKGMNLIVPPGTCPDSRSGPWTGAEARPPAPTPRFEPRAPGTGPAPSPITTAIVTSAIAPTAQKMAIGSPRDRESSRRAGVATTAPALSPMVTNPNAFPVSRHRHHGTNQHVPGGVHRTDEEAGHREQDRPRSPGAGVAMAMPSAATARTPKHTTTKEW